MRAPRVWRLRVLGLCEVAVAPLGAALLLEWSERASELRQQAWGHYS